MRHSRAEQENTWNIERAARYGKPSGGVGGIDGALFLTTAPARVAPEPEPVDVSGINGREALGWERELIEAARMRDRAREWRP